MRSIVALGAAVVVMAACSGSSDDASVTDAEKELSGGATTVHDTTAFAYSLPLANMAAADRRAFAVGNNFFNDNWVTAPASTEGRDGLGPTFNAQSCSSCHFRDGRAEPPTGTEPELGLLFRVSQPGAGGATEPVTAYGDQLQDQATNGVPAEGRVIVTYDEVDGTFADGSPYSLSAPSYEIADLQFGPLPAGTMVSPRIAPAMIGVGLLEAVPEADIRAGADPDDADGDGISGRVNEVVDARTGELVLGRFGWKANVATVEQQVAGAFHGDIGITTSLHPDQNCPAGQGACAAAPSGGDPEVDDAKLERVTFYSRTLAVPARRDVGLDVTDQGEELFDEIGCSSCHTPSMTTGESDIAALSAQAIRPYTDLLLHDLGDGLADGRPDGAASGSEWRTPPLWGIGLLETVNGHTRLLHDGRARNITEAILWHGGEAAGAQAAFTELGADERRALVTFIESL